MIEFSWEELTEEVKMSIIEALTNDKTCSIAPIVEIS